MTLIGLFLTQEPKCNLFIFITKNKIINCIGTKTVQKQNRTGAKLHKDKKNSHGQKKSWYCRKKRGETGKTVGEDPVVTLATLHAFRSLCLLCYWFVNSLSSPPLCSLQPEKETFCYIFFKSNKWDITKQITTKHLKEGNESNGVKTYNN